MFAMISGTGCTKLCHVSGVTSDMLWPLCGMSFEQCKHHGSLSVMEGEGGGGVIKPVKCFKGKSLIY